MSKKESTTEVRPSRYDKDTIDTPSSLGGGGSLPAEKNGPVNEAGSPIQPYEVLAGLAAAYDMAGNDASPLYALTSMSLMQSAIERIWKHCCIPRPHGYEHVVYEYGNTATTSRTSSNDHARRST